MVSNLEEAWGAGSDASAYDRSADGGETWTDSILLGGMAPAVAAQGPDVYVTYWAYDCGGIGIMHSGESGAKGSWSSLVCLTNIADIESAAMAASDGAVYVAARRDSRHVAVWSSRDRGRSWTWFVLGRLTLDDDLWLGSVQIATSGRLAAVAWAEGGTWDNRGSTVWVRTSTDAGLHWSEPRQLMPVPASLGSAAGSDERLAFTGASKGDAWITLWRQGAGWTSLPAPDTSAVVALRPDAQIGVLSSVCDWSSESVSGETRWITSSDDGATWAGAQRTTNCLNEPHLVWAPDGRVLVLHVGEEGYGLSIGR